MKIFTSSLRIRKLYALHFISQWLLSKTRSSKKNYNLPLYLMVAGWSQQVKHCIEGGVGAYKKPQDRSKNRRKPQNRNKFRPKPKTEIKALTDKAS